MTADFQGPMFGPNAPQSTLGDSSRMATRGEDAFSAAMRELVRRIAALEGLHKRVDEHVARLKRVEALQAAALLKEPAKPAPADRRRYEVQTTNGDITIFAPGEMSIEQVRTAVRSWATPVTIGGPALGDYVQGLNELYGYQQQLQNMQYAPFTVKCEIPGCDLCKTLGRK